MNTVKKSKGAEKAMQAVFTACGLAAIVFVLCITVYLVISGSPAIGKIGLKEFLLGEKWAPTEDNPLYGILPFVLTSVYGTLAAVLIGLPIGLLCAMSLAKAAPKRIASVIRPAIDLLAGIPSVVYGLVGMIVLVPTVRKVFSLPDGANLFSAILVLAVMILPSVISVSENAIKSVPREYDEASLALGATKTETLFKVTLPAARSGVAAATVLGIGRAIGEAMAVIMVSGNVANMPRLFKSVRFLTTAIAGEMAYSSGLQRQALFSIALILFIFICIINILLNFVIKEKKK